MSANRELTYADLLQAIERRDPHFADLVIAYLEQGDPPENAPEEPSQEQAPALADDAWTLARLRNSVSDTALWGKDDDERRAVRREAWGALMGAEHPPPRLRLGDLLVELYEGGEQWARAALIDIFRRGRACWGLWRGLKRIYKLVEAGHDAEMFGILAWRLDAMDSTPRAQGEISRATFNYMRRRAWRYLRELGQALPELYPQFAVQVLRHYPASFYFYGSWVASQIWGHHSLIGARSAWFSRPPNDLSKRAFDEAWKLAPEPLLRLLEDAGNDAVCDFAIRSLKRDFPEELRKVEPAWLARIGKKQLESVDEFVIGLLEASPELHQSKLAKLGLHDMVVGLLASDSDRAATYAVEYCTAHAPAIAADELITIAEKQSDNKKVLAFVLARLEKLAASAIGMPLLIRMLAVGALAKLAAAKLKKGYSPADLDEDTYVRLAMGESAQQKFVKELYSEHKQKVPAAFLRAHASHPNLQYWTRSPIMKELGKRKAVEIGVAWIMEALFDSRFASDVSQWLHKGMLQGDDLDPEWLKGLVMRPSQRPLAMTLLGNTKFIAPYRIGLDWFLSLARHSDVQLAEFAHRYLLSNFAPDDVALEMDATDIEVGIDKIWSLLGAKQPAPVRKFAATYLRVHHPEISPTTEEARALGIEPRLPRDSYTLARVRPLFFDHRADVRRFAASIGRYELVRWGDAGLLYDLAASEHRESRALGAEALLNIGDPDAEERCVPPASWLDPGRVFAMAEIPVKASREIALTMIRAHYDVLGGVSRLAWLMDSPDREVRLFAVRLLWDQHRPLVGPRGVGRERFDSVAALQLFLRTVMFGLPPGRMERRDSGDALPDRPLPSSVAKRRLVEVVRDMAIDDADFAAVVAPVLEEFLQSQAKGEWHGCVAALARMRAAHPDLATSLPPGRDLTPPA